MKPSDEIVINDGVNAGRRLMRFRVDNIVVVPGFNCRVVDPKSDHVQALARSIKANGLREYLLLGTYPELPRGTAALVDGENRLAALKINKIEETVCYVDAFESQAHAFIACLAKGLHRKVRTYELAVACERLTRSGFAVDYIAENIGVAPTTVKKLVKILGGIIPEFRDLFRRNDQDVTIEKLLQACVMSPEEQKTYFERIVSGREHEPPDGIEPDKKKRKSTRGRGPTYVKSIIADLHDKQYATIRGERRQISLEARELTTAILRHLLGDIDENPLAEKKGGKK